MRFEGKHKEIKMFARSTCSRKNITLTLAKKMQLKFAHFILQSNNTTIVINPKYCICTLHSDAILNTIYIPLTTYKCYSQVEYMGTVYKRGYCLSKCIDEM